MHTPAQQAQITLSRRWQGQSLPRQSLGWSEPSLWHGDVLDLLCGADSAWQQAQAHGKLVNTLELLQTPSAAVLQAAFKLSHKPKAE